MMETITEQMMRDRFALGFMYGVMASMFIAVVVLIIVQKYLSKDTNP